MFFYNSLFCTEQSELNRPLYIERRGPDLSGFQGWPHMLRRMIQKC